MLRLGQLHYLGSPLKTWEGEVSLPANQNVIISQPGVNYFAHSSLGFLLSASCIFSLCSCYLVISNRSRGEGGESLCTFKDYLSSFSLSSMMLQKLQPFIFSERQPLSLQLRKSCALLGSLSPQKHLQRESQAGNRSICWIFFSEISVAQCLKMVALNILLCFLVC